MTKWSTLLKAQGQWISYDFINAAFSEFVCTMYI